MKETLTSKQIDNLKGETLYRDKVGENILTIKENKHFRWLISGGDCLQSIMAINEPEHLMMPVVHAMLLPYYCQEQVRNDVENASISSDHAHTFVLNLGLGGGAIERALVKQSSTTVTTVELVPEIISLYQEFFNPMNKAWDQISSHSLNKHSDQIINQCALSYLQANQQQFDLVTCDIFSGDIQPSFLFDDIFYENLACATSPQGTVALNLAINDNHQLLNLLTKTNAFFKHRAIVDFIDYKNVVLYLSHSSISEAISKSMVSELGININRYIVID